MANLYDPHPLMIDSGTFWRCGHGSTGLGYTKKGALKVVGCKPCLAAKNRRKTKVVRRASTAGKHGRG